MKSQRNLRMATHRAKGHFAVMNDSITFDLTPDEHLWHGQVAPAEAISARQQVEIAVRRVHQLTAETAVKCLEQRLRVEQEGVPKPVLAVDVSPASQREIHVRKELVGDYVTERKKARVSHVLRLLRFAILRSRDHRSR